LTENGISAETTLNVEYVKALVPPLHVASYEHDDWVSSVDVLSNTSNAAVWTKPAGTLQARILSGSFDGSLRVWNESQEVVATGQWHKASIQAAKWLSPTQIVSAGSDRSIRIWDYENAATGHGKLTPKLELLGHRSVIDSIAVHAPSSRILSASSDHRIGIWSTRKSEGPAVPEPVVPSNKRRKLSGPSISTPQRGALSYLSGHHQHVKAICFDEQDPTVAYSASIDHSVKTWDLPTTTCVDTKTTTQSLLAITHLPDHRLLAAAGALHRIDLVDLRAAATKVAAVTCRGHRNWIRDLARDPDSSFRLVSASDDSSCMIWDIRSTSQEAAGGTVAKPVYTVERQSQAGRKVEQGSESAVYGVAWDQDVGIVSGGQDKMLQINKAP
jgi:ribosome biogenesis protein YTM1